MKSLIINTRLAKGPLSEDEIVTRRIFISTNRYSNTIAEDLSEVFQISIE